MEQQTKNLSGTESKVWFITGASRGSRRIWADAALKRGDAMFSVYFTYPSGFFLTYPLAKKIKQYGFFSYSTNEALHLSDDEKEIVISLFKIIQKELICRIDDFSQDVIISQFELLHNYANRFYKRQFITRKTQNNNLLQKLKNC